jgi:hypothetical protein
MNCLGPKQPHAKHMIPFDFASYGLNYYPPVPLLTWSL